MSTRDIIIRPLEATEEFHRAVEVQRTIWGMPDYHASVPEHVLITAAKNDGLVLGAFDGEEMVGYLFGFLGRTSEGTLKHCSHMMGVVPAYRGRGLSIALKQSQREHVLDQGLDLITWTYDPLETINGYLNIAKLGAICRTYIRDLYGEIQDALNRGLATDRFEVEWWIRSDRAEAAAAGTRAHHALDEAVIVTQVTIDDRGLQRPDDWEMTQAPAVAVQVPHRFQDIKSADIEMARDWRFLTRDVFEAYFAAGYTAVDVVRDTSTEPLRWFYVLQSDDAHR